MTTDERIQQIYTASQEVYHTNDRKIVAARIAEIQQHLDELDQQEDNMRSWYLSLTPEIGPNTYVVVGAPEPTTVLHDTDTETFSIFGAKDQLIVREIPPHSLEARITNHFNRLQELNRQRIASARIIEKLSTRTR